jgi:hypothetical protein
MPTKDALSVVSAMTLRIYRNETGGWAVGNQDGSRGGIFVSYEAAMRFVKTESDFARARKPPGVSQEISAFRWKRV